MPTRTRRRIQTTSTTLENHDENAGVFPRISTPARLVSQQAPISSLPPSSPPSISSHDRPYATSPIVDDPFGFLAAERKLKTQKTRKVLQPRAAHNQATDVLAAMGIKKPPRVDSEESGEEEGDGREAFATPVRLVELQSIPSSAETPTAQSPRVATPRRRKKTRLSTRSSSPSSGSVPQSPSPKKLIIQPVSTRSGLRLNAGKAAGKRPKLSRKKTDKKLTEDDLAAATKEQQALLPRRSTRRAHASGKSVPAKTVRKGAKASGAKMKRGVTKPTSPEPDDGEIVKSREGESFVLSGEEREKFEADRAARREYFRRLDTYAMAEENVYII